MSKLERVGKACVQHRQACKRLEDARKNMKNLGEEMKQLQAHSMT